MLENNKRWYQKSKLLYYSFNYTIKMNFDYSEI